ncbi:hypothetical protein PLICRDRAFT_35327 [Plicaturopsis crispa FD-325 SS-3]|nr:hypothetical protein PLICRDRAFT_35327 [Plicaturopsis crispa FD-325 SS-3]
MGAFSTEIPSELIPWIREQKLFWVASAPLKADGHVNVSPKSLPGTFHVVDTRRVWYEDLTGSGAETIAHLRENARITIMFQAFDAPPRIVRLFGRGTVHEYGSPEYNALVPAAARKPGTRSAIVVDVYKVGSSCGYAIPRYEFKAHRVSLVNWMSKLEARDVAAAGGIAVDGLKAYWAKENTTSLDGLPGMLQGHAVETPPASLEGGGKSWLAADKREGKDGKQTVKGGVQTVKDGKPAAVAVLKRTGVPEEVKLLVAFGAGLLVAAVYIRIAGIA